MDKELRILMLEDVVDDAKLTERELRKGRLAFSAKRVETREAFLEALKDFLPDLILADYSLPTFDSLSALAIVGKECPDTPFIFVSGTIGEDFAIETLKRGATDYVLKNRLSRLVPAVIRALREVEERAERKRAEEELWALSLVDELTRLYNRRGFYTLAEQQLKLANRIKRGMLLLLMDLDGMKWINDTFGHEEGDQALREIAMILNATFRGSDIIARLGGDEFVVLSIGSRIASAQMLSNRLQENLEFHNAKGGRSFKLSISIGIIYYDPEFPCSIDELITKADRIIYEQKWNKQIDLRIGRS